MEQPGVDVFTRSEERHDPFEDYRSQGSALYHDYMARWRTPSRSERLQASLGAILAKVSRATARIARFPRVSPSRRP